MAGNIFADVGFITTGGSQFGVDSGDTPNGLPGYPMANAVTAVGSSQSGGVALAAGINVVTTSTASTGIATVLPVGFLGAKIQLLNNTANVLSVYPPSGGTINGGSANAADATGCPAVSSGVVGSYTYACTSTNGLTWLRC